MKQTERSVELALMPPKILMSTLDYFSINNSWVNV